jgi:hypothetical protein
MVKVYFIRQLADKEEAKTQRKTFAPLRLLCAFA